MKKSVINFVVALVLCAMMSVMAFADEKGKVTFGNDTTINGTVVKKGEYKFTFDEQTNELTIWKGNTAIAKAPARVETRANKANRTTLEMSRKNSDNVLNSISPSGSNKAIVLGNGNDAKATPVPPTLPTLGLSLLSTLQ